MRMIHRQTGESFRNNTKTNPISSDWHKTLILKQDPVLGTPASSDALARKILVFKLKLTIRKHASKYILDYFKVRIQIRGACSAWCAVCKITTQRIFFFAKRSPQPVAPSYDDLVTTT